MNKKKCNYHTHTLRCGHAEGSDEQYVKAAIMANFDILGFSEHMPYKEVDLVGERMLYKDIDEYLNSIEELTIKYKDKIIIKKAFEFEYIGNHDDYLYMMKDKVDYMIIGQHFKFIDGYSYDQLTNDEDVLEYAQAIVEACDKGLVDIIAHPDYFMLGRRDFSKACIEAANMIGAAAKRNNVIVEINLNGLRYGKYKYKEGLLYPYPFRNLYIELEKYNLNYIYGYDAHKPITLLEEERITTVNEILKGINLNIINELGE